MMNTMPLHDRVNCVHSATSPHSSCLFQNSLSPNIPRGVGDPRFPVVYEEESFSFFSFIGNLVTFFIEIIAILLLLFFLLRMFVIERYHVVGNSMYPTLHNQQELFVNSFAYFFSQPKRGDIVVLIPPVNVTKIYVKRIIGLPGETIEIRNNLGVEEVIIYNRTFTNGILLKEPYIRIQQGEKRDGGVSPPYIMREKDENYTIKETLDDNEYFVMGDNRGGSSDSRGNSDDIYSIWHLSERNIQGKVFLVMENLAISETGQQLTEQELQEKIWFSIGSINIPKMHIITQPQYNL